MSRNVVAWMIALLLLTASLGGARAQGAGQVDIRAVDLEFPNVAIDFRVTDAAGRPVLGLSQRDVRIIEDDTTQITELQLEQQVADTTSPTRTLTLVDGQSEPLFTRGATIGVVFDATTLLNGSDKRDYIAEGRRAIEQFLLRTGTLAPRDPEQISLFIPKESPEQLTQPVEFATFTQDRNAVINYMRTLQPRTGKTNLYAAIQEAVQKTAEAARQRGSDAIVLVVSDGGDVISGDTTFEATISQANADKVKIVTFGVGTEKSLVERKGGFRLSQLASGTGGTYLQRPDDAAASTAFATTVTVTPASLYTLRYTTSLRDDGKDHQIVLRVTLPDGSIDSVPIDPGRLTTGPAIQLAPLNDVLLRQYFVFALPSALLIALLIVLLTGGIRWTRSQSLSKGVTKR